ncbi:unnamed protein product [Ostreobium quekettii]|uniref:Ribosomal eL28/Mak16 domain-containing protein n=1 Tax=Ostreobium quekettii TaxID=121088 RepID=A0A8S1IZI5_9CHLO|nr:unnamed protein product [Ostreobium quekettii]
MKSIERAHMPSRLWERVKLSNNYMKALDQIDERLKYWPENLIHKNKQRLTKITQYLIRMKRLVARPRPKLVPIKRMEEKVERKREARAEVVARVDNAIENELLNRLKTGTYGDIYNFPMEQYNKALERELKRTKQEEDEIEEYVEGLSEDEDEDEEEEEDELEEEEEEEEQEVDYVSDVELSEDDIEDMRCGDDGDVGEDDGEPSSSDEEPSEGQGGSKRKLASTPRKAGKKKRRPHVELEYEEEYEMPSHARR